MKRGVVNRRLNPFGVLTTFARPLSGWYSNDNVLAEAIIGLRKSELVWRRRRGPGRSIRAVEIVTLEWAGWFNNRRIMESIGNVPPIENQSLYYEKLEGQTLAA